MGAQAFEQLNSTLSDAVGCIVENKRALLDLIAKAGALTQQGNVNWVELYPGTVTT